MLDSPACSVPTTVLYIKHMVCPRGIRVVRQELEQLGFAVQDVRLVAATVFASAEEIDWDRLRTCLQTARFALLESSPATLLTRIQVAVNRMLRQPETLRHRELIAAVAHDTGLTPARLCTTYARLSMGTTLSAYILGQRVTFAQELLVSSNLRVGLIARQLGYSSLAHFSSHFRGATHYSPSSYRKIFQKPL